MESLQDEGHIKGLDVTTMWGGDKIHIPIQSTVQKHGAFFMPS